MAITVELQAERRPGGNPQVDQAQFGIHEVEIIVQALAAVRPQVGPVRLLVVPGSVGVAGLHRRDDMHQAGMIAALFQHLGDDCFLADVALGDMLDPDPGFSGQRCRRLTHSLTKRRGKVRIVEDADPVGVEEPRHPLGVADGGKRPGYNNPVVAG